MGIKVVLVGSDQRFRDSLRSLLESQDNIDIAAVGEDCKQVIEVVLDLKAALVVLDAGPPNRSCLAAVRQIRADVPDVRLLALGMHADRRLIKEVLEAGASGYLLKDCAFEELATAIGQIVDGQTYVSPRPEIDRHNGQNGVLRAPRSDDP